MSRSVSSCSWALVLVVMTGMAAWAQAGSPADDPAPEPVSRPIVAPVGDDGFFEELKGLVDYRRTGEAVLRCTDTERAMGVGGLPRSIAEVCARAQVGQGDRLYGMAQLEEAQMHWHEALRLEPRLLDVPAFTRRLAAQAPGDQLESLVPLPPAPPPAWPWAPACPPAPEVPSPGTPDISSPGTPDISLTLDEPAVPPGPRAERHIGAGLGFGYDGLMSVVISWMHDERLAVEATVGLLFPTLDSRIRFYGVRSVITPVFGIGMMTPFGGGQDHYDAGIDGGFPDLYSHGAIFHVDVGMSYAPWKHLDIYGGAAFLMSLDGGDEQLVFFPHWSVQAIFYL